MQSLHHEATSWVPIRVPDYGNSVIDYANVAHGSAITPIKNIAHRLFRTRIISNTEYFALNETPNIV